MLFRKPSLFPKPLLTIAAATLAVTVAVPGRGTAQFAKHLNKGGAVLSEEAQWKQFDAGMGLFSEGDYPAAYQKFAPLAKSGHVGSQFLAGSMLEAGLGVAADRQQGVRWLEAALKGRCPQAGFRLGRMFFESNPPMALDYLRAAAELGEPRAQWQLARLLAVGSDEPKTEVARDPLGAAVWAILASENGIGAARGNIKALVGALDEAGQNALQGAVDAQKAKVQAENDRGSVVSLQLPIDDAIWKVRAGLIRSGEQQYLDKDYAGAMESLLPLADAGEAVAQFYVARMFQRGLGCEVHGRNAVRYYTLASHGGNGAAQDNLGLMYLNGECLKPNESAAADLFLLAALRGNVDGQLNFGYCLGTGKGRAVDLFEGYVWYLIAAGNGNAVAQKNLEAVRGDLSAEQLKAAEERAAQLRKVIESGDLDPSQLPPVPTPSYR